MQNFIYLNCEWNLTNKLFVYANPSVKKVKCFKLQCLLGAVLLEAA